MNNKIALIIVCAFLCTYCTQKDISNYSEIFIDFESVKTLDLSDTREIVNIEISDSSIIKRIDEIKIEGNKFFIRSGNSLLLFDENGNFKEKISNKGGGPQEYLSLNSFFFEKDKVNIYDAMGKKMIIYDFNGNFVNSIPLKDKFKDFLPAYIHPVKDNRFISKNTFGGDDRSVPSYSFLNEDFIYEANINDRFLKDGITTLNMFYSNRDNILFWELFNDTIFTLRNDTTYEQKYFVNFNYKALPQSIKKMDLYDAISFSNKQENIGKYATGIRNVSEDTNHLVLVSYITRISIM